MKCVSERTYEMCIRTYLWNVYQNVLYQAELWPSTPTCIHPTKLCLNKAYALVWVAIETSDTAVPVVSGSETALLATSGSETAVSPRFFPAPVRFGYDPFWIQGSSWPWPTIAFNRTYVTDRISTQAPLGIRSCLANTRFGPDCRSRSRVEMTRPLSSSRDPLRPMTCPVNTFLGSRSYVQDLSSGSRPSDLGFGEIGSLNDFLNWHSGTRLSSSFSLP